MKIYVEDFPEYDGFPEKGRTRYHDSMVHDLDFEKDGTEYYVKAHVDIEYDRYYDPGDWEDPGEDSIDVINYDYEIIKAYKYVKNDEIELEGKELRKIKNYIIENLEIV
jgi:hypothetical protein